jgi:hypothetical protein
MKTISFPVPIFIKPQITECSIIPPTTGVIMQTKKVIETGNYFTALQKFLTGTIIIDNDKEKTKRLVLDLPIQTAEYLSIEVMLLQYQDDDGVEGIYYCPRCGKKKICEATDEYDTRDFISELEINYYTKELNEITNKLHVELRERKTGHVVLETQNITMRLPILKDYIEAANKVGYSNHIDIQNEVFIKTITKVNGEEFTKEKRNRYGKKIIEKSNPRELNQFSREINSYGLMRNITKNCNNCGKQWKAEISTNNFFVSALQ